MSDDGVERVLAKYSTEDEADALDLVHSYLRGETTFRSVAAELDPSGEETRDWFSIGYRLEV